jgi:lysophospholipase L1-like esterase
MNKFFSLLAVSLVSFGLVAVPPASAKSPEARQSLVSLGDSITFGYNLGINNEHPSKEAFPYVIGQDEGFRVRDLGVPGWTSDQLLDALNNDPAFVEAVRHADVITLDIGNNDLLHGLAASQVGHPNQIDSAILQGYIADMLTNLNAIITDIQSQSNAKIVVYNVYNAFQVTDPLHPFSNQLLLNYINTPIRNIALAHNVALADAYSAFGENQALYVRQGDIHPTELGQALLAKIGEKALGY